MVMEKKEERVSKRSKKTNEKPVVLVADDEPSIGN